MCKKKMKIHDYRPPGWSSMRDRTKKVLKNNFAVNKKEDHNNEAVLP